MAMVLNQSQLFRHPVFLFLGLVFLINLLACTLFQSRKLRWSAPLAIWGSVIFHWGLIFVTCGALLSFAYKVEGYLVLGEGQEKALTPTAFSVLETGRWQRQWPGWNLQLLEQKRHWRADGTLAYTSSLVMVKTERGEEAVWIEKGQPLIIGDWRFFHYATGYAPGLVVKKDGELVGAFLLPAEKTDENEQGYRIKLLEILPDLKLSGIFYPDEKNKNSEKLINPMLIVKAGEEVELRPGQVRNLGPYQLELGEIRAWVGLETVYDPGAKIVFAGSWLATAGLGLWFTGKNRRR
ncbi:ResB-like family protein [Carboxydocella sporoproducens DSM 16521]|uniref:ResB-like family protein n=2 Tax=Carboxydocella TaxID=178898 RepID=A0A1T4SCN5_9FIRM|nr:ResB-like family protein [Carboxydocella thermautotrophica]AVX31292.1 ResB-like family protein [Carboxydocella thermautotrophica]SKA26024.1 ResB-like family protein [Carboxydocella sporoproducens DSM 16521]